MKVTINKDIPFYIIGVEGDLDASSSITLDTAIQDAVKQQEKQILIDCYALNYISSAGLGVFMSYLDDFENNNTYMALFGLSPKVKNVFEILGLDQLVKIYSTKDEAIMAFNEAQL